MKKKRVISIHDITYKVEDSEYGKDFPKIHPCFSHKFRGLTSYANGIEVGDLLRADGYPFKSKPRVIWRFETISKEDNIRHVLKIPVYRPAQLPSGLWVLRKV